MDYGLYLISRELAHEERSLEYFKLPPFADDWGHEGDNPLILVNLDLRHCGVVFFLSSTFVSFSLPVTYSYSIFIPFFYGSVGTLFPSLTNTTCISLVFIFTSRPPPHCGHFKDDQFPRPSSFFFFFLSHALCIQRQYCTVKMPPGIDTLRNAYASPVLGSLRHEDKIRENISYCSLFTCHVGKAHVE
jgi:hypothetical protein